MCSPTSILLGIENTEGMPLLTAHFYFADTQDDRIREEVVYQQHRMAAENVVRRAPDCLPMGTEIPLRFTSGVCRMLEM